MKSLTWKQHVHELAIGGTRAQLFDFAETALEALVDPGEHIVPGEILCGHVR